MHSYRFVFQSEKDEHQGFVVFPSDVAPILPAIGDHVHWVALNGENLHGSVRERSFRYECTLEHEEQNVVATTFVHLKLDEAEQ
jgi:hypothetical protein